MVSTKQTQEEKAKTSSLSLRIVRNGVRGSSTHCRASGGKGYLCCCLSATSLPAMAGIVIVTDTAMAGIVIVTGIVMA